MKRALGLVAMAVVVAVTLPGIAAAGQKYPTEVTFDVFCGNGFCPFQPDVGNDWIYGGEVDSPKRACRVGRRVEVYELRDGRRDLLRGFGFTDSRGHWFVQRPDYEPETGDYQAKAPKLKLANGKVCKTDRSEIVED